MSTYNENINKLNQILENNHLLVFMGSLKKRTITVTFETPDGKRFIEDFKCNGKDGYIDFNKYLRGLKYD